MLKNYYKNIILYDFILKTQLINIFQLIKIKKIYININFKNIFLEKNKIINSILFLKLLLNKKIKINKLKKNNIFLKIKKNTIIDCKTILYKKTLFFFLEKFILFILPEINKIKLKKKNIINFKFNNILDFIEFKTEFIKFKNIPAINISLYTNNNKNLKLLLNFFFNNN
jgi:ribosomal protein L5